LPYTDLAVMTPFIKSAHEIYLNGTLIGSLGRISQDGKTLEQKARSNYYLIPDSLLKKNNVLAIRISDRLGQINILHPFFYIGAKEKIIESFDSLLVRFSGIAAIFFIGFLFHLKSSYSNTFIVNKIQIKGKFPTTFTYLYMSYFNIFTCNNFFSLLHHRCAFFC